MDIVGNSSYSDTNVKSKKKKKETIHWTLPFYPANSLRMIITVYIFEAEILYDHAEGNNLFLSTDSPPSY